MGESSITIPNPVIPDIRKHEKEKLKKCPECGFVWEFNYQKKTIHRYADFPSYGLKKEICKKCSMA
ncbi:MAG: hypothetical protein QGG04_04075 [Candidatus Marinimicrobia bacterium]|nr:hypothetical protein [Candidatus Neomarinimicrobiota bacterium]MDP7028300.1 hypothetical protein [Candidatus Neomarinimicrobiota bacterium]HJM95784.1 hypothetical protein [Candidatus Neomarinimicrobiota bacterium]